MKPVVLLIGIHGQIGQGKSEFWKVVRDSFPDFHVKQLKFAQPLYDGLLAINPVILFDDGSVERLSYLVARVGWEKAKEVPEVRRLLQAYGTEGGRDIHGAYCWVRLFENRLKECLQSYIPNTIIINDDLRFPEEFLPHEAYGGITVKLYGPNRRSHTAEAAQHSSENRLTDHKFDYLLYNTGTLEEYRKNILTILTTGKPTSGPVTLGSV